MEATINRKHIQFSMKRRTTLGSMENKENLQQKAEKSSTSYSNHWNRYDSLRMEFSHLASDAALSSDDANDAKDIKDSKDTKDTKDLNMRQWTSFVGVDTTMMNLEEQLISLVENIDSSIYKLVQKTRSEFKTKGRNKLTALDVEKLRQTAASRWKWLHNLSEVIQKHFLNASEYHLFYQTLLEFQISIPQIGVVDRIKLVKEKYEGNYEEANSMYKILKDHLVRYLKWWQKVEAVIIESRKLKPLGLRMKTFDFKRPATMLTSFHGNSHFYKDEKVFVSKSGGSSSQYWDVEGLNDQHCSSVPSICMELCPPDVHGIERALMLRLDLLASWTTDIKELGGILMSFIATVLGYWSHLDISSCLEQQQSRSSISKSLDTIEALLNTYWTNSPMFMSLQTRIRELKLELEIQEDQSPLNETQINRNTMFLNISTKTLEEVKKNESCASLSRSETFILQKRAITVLVKKYQDLHKYWDEYRKLVDNSSELALIAEIRNAKERSPTPTNTTDEVDAKQDVKKDYSPYVTDQLLSYLSSDDQQGWSKYLQLLKEKFHNPAALNSSSTNRGALINVLPRNLELISKSQHTDVKSSKQQSRVDLELSPEHHLKFFNSSKKQPQPNVDISQYFQDSLLPNTSNNPSQKNSRRNSFDVESRYSTLASATSLFDHINCPSLSSAIVSPGGNTVSRANDRVFFSESRNTPKLHSPLIQSPSSTRIFSSATMPRTRSNNIRISVTLPDSNTESLLMRSNTFSSSRRSNLTSPPIKLPSSASPNISANTYSPIVTTRSQTLSISQMSDYDRVTKLRNPDFHVQSCYLVVKLPCIDRIKYILDKKAQKQLTYDEARESQLIDEFSIRVLDTETNTKHFYQSALSKGLIVLNSVNNTLQTETRTTLPRSVSTHRSSVGSKDVHYETQVFKICGVYNVVENHWMSLIDSVNSNILNIKTGLLLIDKTNSNYEHIIIVMRLYPQLINFQRLYHFNINSLPKELTIELTKI